MSLKLNEICSVCVCVCVLWWFIQLCLLSVDIMATIGFRLTAYTVVEGVGSAEVEVALLSGTIPPGNQVVVTLTTSSDTASGIYPGSTTTNKKSQDSKDHRHIYSGYGSFYMAKSVLLNIFS